MTVVIEASKHSRICGMSVARSAVAVVLVVLFVCRYSSAQDCSGAPPNFGNANR